MYPTMKLYFRLKELANRWQITEEEILHMAAKGRLGFSIWWRGKAGLIKNDTIEEWRFINEFIAIDSRKFAIAVLENLYTSSDAGEMRLHEGYLRDGRKILLHCERSYENYVRMTDDLIVEDGVLVEETTAINPPLICLGNIMVLPEEVKRIEAAMAEGKNRCQDKTTSPKTERTDIHIIGGLLDIVKGEYTCELPFKTNQGIIDVLVEKLDGFSGISKRTLEERFAKARKALSEYY